MLRLANQTPRDALLQRFQPIGQRIFLLKPTPGLTGPPARTCQPGVTLSPPPPDAAGSAAFLFPPARYFGQAGHAEHPPPAAPQPHPAVCRIRHTDRPETRAVLTPELAPHPAANQAGIGRGSTADQGRNRVRKTPADRRLKERPSLGPQPLPNSRPDGSGNANSRYSGFAVGPRRVFSSRVREQVSARTRFRHVAIPGNQFLPLCGGQTVPHRVPEGFVATRGQHSRKGIS